MEIAGLDASRLAGDLRSLRGMGAGLSIFLETHPKKWKSIFDPFFSLDLLWFSINDLRASTVRRFLWHKICTPWMG
ncbi:MAG: hypothetical protein D6723_07240 [Acidobacteria bacterium]|nr:MAG: hypothetical protein D6723_07240 [Acidobacteriota bacterium]